MRLLILGLRRSGTTVFWESFRADPRLLCYDEPFNPLLRELPRPEPKGTRDEFIALFRRDPGRFRERFAPIERSGELESSLGERQRSYLRFLLESGDRVVIDTTRCHFKLAALREMAPDARVVHLLRPAAPWVSSHLAPRRRGWRGRILARFERATFFSRRSRYGNWGMEEVIGTSPDSPFGRRLAEGGLDPDVVYALPAAGRLLASWKLHRDRIEAEGRRTFGDSFLTVHFPDFCRDPKGVLARVYDSMGLELPPGDGLRDVHPARGAFRPDDRRWFALAERIGLDPRVDPLF